MFSELHRKIFAYIYQKNLDPRILWRMIGSIVSLIVGRAFSRAGKQNHKLVVTNAT